MQLFDERWVETIGGLIEENVALLKRLEAAGRPVYALSNFASVKFALARQMLDFLNEFDISVISGHVCVVKPDPPIYQILFERARRDPSELLFVDDSLANVRAAEEAGIRRRASTSDASSAPAARSRSDVAGSVLDKIRAERKRNRRPSPYWNANGAKGNSSPQILPGVMNAQ